MYNNYAYNEDIFKEPCALKESIIKPAEGTPEPFSEDEADAAREKAIICRACGNVVTKPEEQIEIEGKSVHKFVNPAGIIYRIGCFRNARGCAVLGEPTREFTWFPGYSWSFAVCSNCLAHLGWRYTSGDSGFFGLVLDNISENEI